MAPERIESPWQVTEKQIPDRLWDAIIVGAGPAGATAAIRLAERGHSVLLIERHRFPREKVCGDGLLPDALVHLSSLGLADEIKTNAFPIAAMRVFSPGGVEFEVPGSFMSLERSRLDTMIVKRAAAVGAIVCQAEVCRIAVSEPRCAEVILQGSNRAVRARYIIIATGAQTNLANKLSLVQDTRPTALAMRCYVQSKAELSYPILSYHKAIRPGYAWVFPLGHGRYNVGCGMLTDGQTVGGAFLRRVYQKFIESFPPASTVISQAIHMTALRGAALRCGLPEANQPVKGPVIAIGETIGTTLPFTGEGIGTAMNSAQLAAGVVHDALLADDDRQLARFPQLLDEQLRPSFSGYRTAQRWLAMPWVGDFVAKRIRKSAYLREACRNIILGTVSPRAVYSVSGIVKSLWE